MCGLITIFSLPTTYEPLDTEVSIFLSIGIAVYLQPIGITGLVYGLIVGLILGWKNAVRFLHPMEEKMYFVTNNGTVSIEHKELFLFILIILFFIAFIVHFFTFEHYLGGFFDYLVAFLGGFIPLVIQGVIFSFIGFAVASVLRFLFFWLLIVIVFLLILIPDQTAKIITTLILWYGSI